MQLTKSSVMISMNWRVIFGGEMDQQDISGGRHVVCSWIFLTSFDADLNQRRGVRMKMHDKNPREKLSREL
ncbi:hypothetical protein KHC17_01630 [Agrobacterium salinitolerans]|uniref:hypothetical protein n=1 Tax=Agrobacterium salinitolerans TaxID=1183413 RepID=UPI001C237AC9|nr:hypothetical protein [Agrobacterium salinitolerans]QXC48835.1 hypothetical protein KHC17_01630 [Agrobacterium salinitolerans]